MLLNMKERYFILILLFFDLKVAITFRKTNLLNWIKKRALQIIFLFDLFLKGNFILLIGICINEFLYDF